jgi:hypothetical protein
MSAKLAEFADKTRFSAIFILPSALPLRLVTDWLQMTKTPLFPPGPLRSNPLNSIQTADSKPLVKILDPRTSDLFIFKKLLTLPLGFGILNAHTVTKN